MLSSLSSLADRNFVIAFLLPVILASLALMAMFVDMPSVASVLSEILDADKFTTLTLLVLGMWTGAVLLMVLNIFFYRILEGYTGPLAGEKATLRLLAKRNIESDALDRQADAIGDDAVRKRKYYEALRDFRRRFPDDEDLMLPTRFGNVLRSSEVYADEVYGADSVALWPRLCGVIPQSYAGLIDNARAEMDFCVNSVILAALLAVVAALRICKGIVLAAMTCSFTDFPWLYLLVPFGAAIAARLAYEGAIYRAGAWGDLFRSAFDLYLGDLAKQLGYALPTNEEERKIFWSDLNGLFLDKIPVESEEWPPAD